jgi:TolB-like protein/Flp pilus assembly protein TadD
MADIFISYCSKDRAQAEQLIELLASAGLSVWIDRQGIVGAEKWATEIVEGIKGCSTFILLLSPNSVKSENVLRELSLASEKRKRVLPIDLEPIELPSSFEYPLAGLQRVAITEFDKILHAHKHGVKKVIHKDERKSLMILPFDDLSPTGDNGWFADGIVSELISALSNVKSIRIADNQATKEFKKYNGQLTNYAREMNYRYFVQGDVRKFGDQIKISARLLDIETGDHLWQDSMKGVMNDIFEIQEAVALKVVEGLKVHLASDEKKKLAARGTENAEAYELHMKASEYFQRQTKEGFQLAAQLLSEAIALDPAYAIAYPAKASALANLYRNYTRDPALLEEGLTLINEARRLKPDLWAAYNPLALILLLQGKHAEAEAAAKDYIRKAPEDSMSHFALGFFYWETGQDAKAIAPYEESLKRKPEQLHALFNLVVACTSAKEEEKQKHWAEIAIPLYEKRLKLFPDEEKNRVNHALLLYFAGRDDEARAAVRKLEDLRDGTAVFNTACLQCMLKDYPAGILTFRKAIQAGYRNMRPIKSFLDDEIEGIGTLKGTPEWEAVRELVEKLEADAEAAAEANSNG